MIEFISVDKGRSSTLCPSSESGFCERSEEPVCTDRICQISMEWAESYLKGIQRTNRAARRKARRRKRSRL